MKKILRFNPNTPVHVKKMYDKPFYNESGKYGPNWGYTVMQDGDEVTFKCGKVLHEKIDSLGLPVGASFTIEKCVDSTGSTLWDVKASGSPTTAPTSAPIPVSGEPVDFTSLYRAIYDSIDFVPDNEKREVSTTIFIAETNLMNNLMRQNKKNYISARLEGMDEDLPF